MSFLNSIFNSIGYTRSSNGQHEYTQQKGSVTTLGGEDKLKLSLDNPVLSSIFNIRANYLSKAVFYVKEKDGTRNYDDPSLSIIKHPNAYQSQEDFLKQYEWLRCSYGWVYQKPFGISGYDNTSIFNLNPSNIEFPKEMGDVLLWKNKDVKDYFKQAFIYSDNKTKKSISFNDIIPFYDVANGLSNSDISAVTSPSRIDSIIKQVSNISLASDAENVVIQTNGREMIFAKSNDKATFETSVPVGENNKNAIQNTLNNKYLIKSGRSRTLTPDKELAWVDMSITASKLGLHESITNNASLCTQAYGVPNEIYKSYKQGSTFENQEKALIGFIQGVIQPVADDLASSWTTSFGDVDRPFMASFEHLPTMQVVEHKKADKALKVSTALKNLTQTGLTPEQAIIVMEGLGVNIELDD